MAWFKNRLCGICRGKLKEDPARVVLNTADGDLELRVCAECEENLKKIAEVGSAMRSELGEAL